MQTKATTPINVISLSKKATMETIVDDIGNSPDVLMEDIQKQGIEPAGPMIFVYRNCSCEMDKPFDLEIAQPVKSTENYQGCFNVNTLEPITYVERNHHGSLADLGSKGYEPFIEDIKAAGLVMTDQCREVYHRYDRFDSPENVTEIQMEIAE